MTRYVDIKNGSSQNIVVFVTTSIVYKIGTILPDHVVRWEIPDHFWAGNFRCGEDLNATRAEFVFNDSDKDRYCINSTPPGSHPGSTSYARCVHQTKKSGFNVEVSITPSDSKCPPIECRKPGSLQAKTFPSDNDKIHSCANTNNYLVIFGKPSKSTNIYGNASKIRLFRKEGLQNTRGKRILPHQY
jgi:hypothetical protein